MRIIIVIGLICVIFLGGCTRLILDYDFANDTDWIVAESDHFTIHYRKEMSQRSIDKLQVDQEAAYSEINQKLDLNFGGIISYYLLDYDESNFALLVGEDGSHVDPVTSSIYTVLAFGDDKADIAQLMVRRAMGLPGNDLIADGLAIATAGEFKYTSIDSWISTFFLHDFPLLTLEDMLFNSEKFIDYQIVAGYRNVDHYNLYIPQAGKFVEYLLEEFGREKVFSLYNVSAEKFRWKVMEIFGITFDEMEFDFRMHMMASY